MKALGFQCDYNVCLSKNVSAFFVRSSLAVYFCLFIYLGFIGEVTYGSRKCFYDYGIFFTPNYFAELWCQQTVITNWPIDQLTVFINEFINISQKIKFNQLFRMRFFAKIKQTNILKVDETFLLVWKTTMYSHEWLFHVVLLLARHFYF